MFTGTVLLMTYVTSAREYNGGKAKQQFPYLSFTCVELLAFHTLMTYLSCVLAFLVQQLCDLHLIIPYQANYNQWPTVLTLLQ